MAVKTSPFTGWRLSGKDAKAFLNQIETAQPNKLAQEALQRGRALYKKTINKNVPITPKKVSILNRVAKKAKQASGTNFFKCL